MVDTIQVNGPDASYLGKYYTKLTIGEYSRPKPFSSSEFKNKKIMYFPLPVDLRDNTSVGYNNKELETVGDVINGDILTGVGSALIRNSGDILNNIAKNIVGAKAETKLGTSSKLAAGLEKFTSDALDAGRITSAIQQMSGMAPNPNPSVMFTGPELRDFSHSWTFYPKNQEESITLQRIIKHLKMSALPQNTFYNAAAILNYPNMVQLNFYPWDTNGNTPWGWNDETSILRYKKCVMKNLSVNYSPGGAPGFFEGTLNGPVATTITISFMEIEYMLSGDWGGGKGIGEGTLSNIISAVKTGFNYSTNPLGSIAYALTGAVL